MTRVERGDDVRWIDHNDSYAVVGLHGDKIRSP
jgi:hypothetical protein